MVSDKTIKSIFGVGLEVGVGLACNSSPFTEFLITEYYDGPVEGFAMVAASDSIMYFRKIWWDHMEENRLFEGFLFKVDVLTQDIPQLHDLFRRHSSNVNWSNAFSDKDLALATDLKNYAMRPNVSERFNIFGVGIEGEIFILPSPE